MYDLLIIGGGLQGVFFAHAFHSRGLADADRIAIVDPNETLAAVWDARCSRVGMDMLRSPSSHNMDPDYRALRRFARRHGYSSEAHLHYPYARPSLKLFNDQLHRIIETDGLKHSHLCARVVSIEARKGGFRAHTPNGAVDASLVILATGSGGLQEPGFIKKNGGPTERISHLFSDTDAIDSVPVPADDMHARAASMGERILILGGGISGWQAALRYARLGAARVTVASPHPIRESIFDSDPCYIGPKCGNEYRSLSIPERIEKLKAVRYPGTVPPELAVEARNACTHGRVDTLEMVANGVKHESGGIRAVAGSGAVSDVYDRITAATGLTCELPYPQLVRSIADSLSLDVHASGHPVLSSDLSWTSGLFVTGRLGELEIGPQAGNIVGAHLAFRRIRDSVANAVGAAARMHPAGG